MGDQQQLNHPSLYNVTANPRPSDHSMMAMPYYSNQPTRLDTMTIPAAAPTQLINTPYYTDTMAQFYYRQMAPPPMMCAYNPGMSETPMPAQISAAHREYPQVAVSSQPFQAPLGYQMLIGHQPMPPQLPSQPQPRQAAAIPTFRHTTSRAKRVLEVTDPKTRTRLNLCEDSTDQPSTRTSKELPPPTPVVPDESPPIDVCKIVNHEKQPSPEPERPDSHDEDTKVNVSAVETGLKTVISSEGFDSKADESDVCDVGVDQQESDLDTAVQEAKVTRLLGETTDVESSAVSDEGEDDEVARRVYNREFLLKCRQSRAAKYPPEDFRLIQLADPRCLRRLNRNSQRTAQRIIRLNTGITVKRIEGAFVPSQLQKKEANGEIDPHQVLSRELNVILNRLSDANLTETVADIRKLSFTSPDDLQLLAKLVFQKGIRQPKYSKVFAQLCKQLKGFEVQGSETLEVMVIQQSQELFNTPLEVLIAELNAIIDSKIESAKDESIKKILREDRDTNILKKTEAYYGNITFLAELFLCRLFAPKTILHCLRKLRESSAPEALTSMIILLTTCGAELEQQSKSQLDECFAKLNTYLKSDKIPAHQSYKIQELCELRARNWKKLDPTQPAPPTSDGQSRRVPDDKMRRSHPQPPLETRRKPAQIVNPLTPSSLAVTQQPHDSRKLGPMVANWTQGSGQFHKNPADDSANQGSSNKRLPNPANRSREASPRVPVVQNAWLSRPFNNAKLREDYATVLGRNQGNARRIIDMLRSNEDGSDSIIQDTKDVDRCALLHTLLELSMDKDEKLRDTIGILLSALLNKGVPPNDLISASRKFFEKCDDGFLEDYPKGWEYIAQILQHLIQKENDHLNVLLSILEVLKSGGRCATILAHCLRLSAKRLGEDVVRSKWRANKLDWKSLCAPGDVRTFVEKFSVGFTITPVSGSKLNELADLCANQGTPLERLTTFFKQFSVVPTGFVRSCVNTMILNSEGLSRQCIDHRVLGLSILVDHKPEREAEVVSALQECTKATVDQWRKSLLDKKVISSEAFRTSNMGDSITKSLIRDS